MTPVATIPIRDDFTPPGWWPPKPTRATVDELVTRASGGEIDPRPAREHSLDSTEFYHALRLLVALPNAPDPKFHIGATPEKEAEARRIGYAYVDARAKELGYQA